MGRHLKRNSLSTSSRLAVAGIALAGASAMLAPAAQAAPDSDWDRLAQCESGGNWAINTGNGFHGGLQFSPSTWNGYGGQEFAPYAYQASREQQIIVAERVLAGQGWGAWPACSASLGLNSAPTPRTAAKPAPQPRPKAPAPAPQVQRAVRELANKKDVLAIDALYEEITQRIEAAGFRVPPQVTAFYKLHRKQLNPVYQQYAFQIKQVLPH